MLVALVDFFFAREETHPPGILSHGPPIILSRQFPSSTNLIAAMSILVDSRSDFGPNAYSLSSPVSDCASLPSTSEVSRSEVSTPATTCFDISAISPSSPKFLDIEEAPEPYSLQCDSIIFDLGDVLFHWSAETDTCIPSKTLRKIVRSVVWFEYEKGNISEQEAFSQAAKEHGFTSEQVRLAFRGARKSLNRNPLLINLIRELKEQYGVRVFAMSNISQADLEYLRDLTPADEWALFDRVFTSSEARERKPNLGFYKFVLEKSGCDPARTLFIDDKLENVLPARSLGIKSLVFGSFENIESQIRNYVGNPVTRGEAWLRANAKRMISVTNGGIRIHENFAALLTLEATGDRSLVEFVEHPRTFNFFIGESHKSLKKCSADTLTDALIIIGTPIMTSQVFPDDLDTTSIGLSVTNHVDFATKMSVMDEMLQYVNRDGIIQTYFDNTRPRIGS